MDTQPEQLRISTHGMRMSIASDVQIGDELEDIYGSIYYEQGSYGLLVDGKLALKRNGQRPGPVLQRPSEKTLRVASYNVLNLNVENMGQVHRVAQDIGRLDADLVGLVEIVDDSAGSGCSDKLLQMLCELLVPMNRNYAYSYVMAQSGMDGGKPGANIKQALLYSRDRFEEVSRRAVAKKACDETLSNSPCRISPDSAVFEESRKPLAVLLTERATGRSVSVIVNHLKSMRGGTFQYGRIQPPVTGSSDVRTAQARLVAEYIERLTTPVVCVGDFNDQPFSQAVAAFGSLTDAHAHLSPVEQYSYVYQGQSQKIDYIFTSLNVVQSGIAHVNTHKSQRSQTSDHDPVYADLE